MKNLYQQAYFQSGQEILNGQLEPSCYASVLAESGGNATRAMGLYAERRAADLYQDLLKREAREHLRLKAMLIEPQGAVHRRSDHDILRPLLLVLTVFFASTSNLLVLCSVFSGNICEGRLGEILITALVLTGACLSGVMVVRLVFSKVDFTKVMMPFAAALALVSLASASYMVRKHQGVSWQASAETIVSVDR